MSVFPMNAPRYAVYMMLDEPHANASTHGYATAGWVAAPAAGRVIARIGPMMGLLPDVADKAAIDQALYIPLEPAPIGRRARPPLVSAKPPAPAGTPATAPASVAPALRVPLRDLRHEAADEATRTVSAVVDR